jgi:hypothetical protein
MGDREEAKRLVVAIRRNVDQFYAEEITRAQFEAQQLALWTEVVEKCLIDQVDEILCACWSRSVWAVAP